MLFPFRTQSCGKLILSGEHSVCHGGPAVGMPVPLGLDILWEQAREGISVHTASADEALVRTTLEAFREHRPDALPRAGNPGIHLRISGSLPPSSGLGSSSALILGVLKGCLILCGENPDRLAALMPLARQVENRVHGVSSGFDLELVAAERPLVRMPGASLRPWSCPPWPLALVLTGPALSATGDCVAHVASLRKPPAFWHQWHAVTGQTLHALETADALAFREAVRQNHILLKAVGVVPEKIARLIETWESTGQAGKVCGAGTVAGEQAGAVLMTLDPDAPETGLAHLKQLVGHTGFTVIPFVPGPQG